MEKRCLWAREPRVRRPTPPRLTKASHTDYKHQSSHAGGRATRPISVTGAWRVRPVGRKIGAEIPMKGVTIGCGTAVAVVICLAVRPIVGQGPTPAPGQFPSYKAPRLAGTANPDVNGI